MKGGLRSSTELSANVFQLDDVETKKRYRKSAVSVKRTYSSMENVLSTAYGDLMIRKVKESDLFVWKTQNHCARYLF
jgi:hypothetical protein